MPTTKLQQFVTSPVLVALLTLTPPAAPTGLALAQSPDAATSRAAAHQSGTPIGGAATSAAPDSLFRRAERLVREGRGEAGRTLVDTLLARTQPGSPQHAQALYWHASLAGDAAEAERGYRRVIVEYPATRWAGDALLNLAQLEMARGDQEQALVHLHRFEREYPSHESRARASLWLARLHFDKKDEASGCAALATARVSASPEDVELRNQIDYYGQRCLGVDTAVAAAPPRPPPSPPPRDTATATDTATREQREQQVGTGRYTVQVAAYDARPAAEALIERLRARGYTARLATTERPFRVRIGRYDTRAEAVAALERLKAKGIEGFVTEVER